VKVRFPLSASVSTYNSVRNLVLVVVLVLVFPASTFNIKLGLAQFRYHDKYRLQLSTLLYPWHNGKLNACIMLFFERGAREEMLWHGISFGYCKAEEQVV